MLSGDLTFDSYRPGALAAIVALHMDYYAANWNFGLPFETRVAGDMAAFLPRFDASHDLFVNAFDNRGVLQGSITIDGADSDGEGAQLRWFVVSGAMRGQGLGRTLMGRADQFIRERGFARTYLTTFAGLDAARRLYEEFGFRLVSEEADDPWSGSVGLQRFERG